MQPKTKGDRNRAGKIRDWWISRQSPNDVIITPTTVARGSKSPYDDSSRTHRRILGCFASRCVVPRAKSTYGKTVVALTLPELDSSRYRLHNWLRDHDKSALRTCLIASPLTGVPVRSGFYPALLQIQSFFAKWEEEERL